MNTSERVKTALVHFLGQKFLLTAGSLLAVFLLLFCNRDVSKLEIIVPAILLFYNGANVMQKHVLKVNQNGTDSSSGSGNGSG